MKNLISYVNETIFDIEDDVKDIKKKLKNYLACVEHMGFRFYAWGSSVTDGREYVDTLEEIFDWSKVKSAFNKLDPRVKKADFWREPISDHNVVYGGRKDPINDAFRIYKAEPEKYEHIQWLLAVIAAGMPSPLTNVITPDDFMTRFDFPKDVDKSIKRTLKPLFNSNLDYNIEKVEAMFADEHWRSEDWGDQFFDISIHTKKQVAFDKSTGPRRRGVQIGICGSCWGEELKSAAE